MLRPVSAMSALSQASNMTLESHSSLVTLLFLTVFFHSPYAGDVLQLQQTGKRCVDQTSRCSHDESRCRRALEVMRGRCPLLFIFCETPYATLQV